MFPNDGSTELCGNQVKLTVLYKRLLKKKGKCIRGRKHKHPILPGLYISPENTEKSTNFNLTKCSGDLFITCF